MKITEREKQLLRRTAGTLGKIVLISVVMGAGVWAVNHVMPGGKSLRGIVNLAAACSTGRWA